MKKTDTTTVLLGGGLVALVAIAAVTLLRPRAQGGEGMDAGPVNPLAPTDTFSVHNTLGFYGYDLYSKYVLGVDRSTVNPLAPRPGGYYGQSEWEKIAAQYGSGAAVTPPSTSSPLDSSEGFTPAGNTGTGFGVSAGGYYR